jgi:hypothetical protein
MTHINDDPPQIRLCACQTPQKERAEIGPESHSNH